MGQVYGRSATSFAVEAVRLAAADAGLQLSDVDGLLTSSGTSGGVGLGLQRDLELHDLKLLSEMQGYGSTAGAMVQVASMAVQAGMAEVVACVFADAPLTPGRSAGRGVQRVPGRHRPARTAHPYRVGRPAGLDRRHREPTPCTPWRPAGTCSATGRRPRTSAPSPSPSGPGRPTIPGPRCAQPLTLADHQASRWIADPFRLLDCCLVSNGGIAVVVTTEARARSLAQPPVPVLGWAQSHPGPPL